MSPQRSCSRALGRVKGVDKFDEFSRGFCYEHDCVSGGGEVVQSLCKIDGIQAIWV